MAPVNRRVTYKLYPTAAQERQLWQCHKLHCDLCNAARQERIDAYRLARKSIGFAARCKSLIEIRADHPEYRALNAQSAQVTLKRLELAFAAFFRRVKESGKDPGFPRFRSYERFSGFGFKHHGDGSRFTPGPNGRNGKLRLSGIGTMDARGEARTPGQVVGCDIMRKAQKAGLNRAISDTAPGSFLNVLCIKAEEAGCQLILLDPRRHRSSQTCPCCASVRKKRLAERQHHCGCGFVATRDQAAALSMLADGLNLLGREPTWVARPETPSRAA
jgi:transposase